MQSDLKLGLLTGSRAKTDAWLFSAVLFSFCLAGSQEEQGLECEPFGGGLRPPLLGCFAGAGLAGAAFPGRWLRTYLVHRWPGSTWNSPLVGRVKAMLLGGTRLVTSHPSPFGTGEARCHRSQGGEGAFPTRTRTQLTERKVLCPNRYQHLRGSVGDILGAGHSGSLSCLGTWRDNCSHRLGRGQELEPLTNRPELAGHS